MNLQSLKYLAAVAEHRHFSKAADVCCISQPTLSMQIKKLEDQLGVQLIERTNKTVLMTDIGMQVAERAQTILNEIEQIRQTAKTAKNLYSGEIKIGIISTLAPYLLPLIIPKLSQHYPQLTLYLIEGQTTQLVEKLKRGELDAAIMALPFAEESFTSTLLFEEKFLLATSKTHPLAKRKTIKQQDLRDQIVFLLEEGHCLREQALEICHALKASEVKNFRATSLETLRHMVAAGAGVTLMPKLACRFNVADVTYIPFSSPQPKRLLGLFWRNTVMKEALLKEIRQHIITELAPYL